MKIFQVDSFTDKPFKGNPAGVCLLEKEQPDSWMQNVAMEMNLSETAFLLKIKKGFDLRWFTPKIEVSLCGHATLGSAHILWEEKILDKKEPAIFNTRSGELVCEKVGDWIAMEFPLRLVTLVEPSNVLLSALSLEKRDIECYVYDDNKDRLFLIELPSDEMVKKLTPDFVKLKEEKAMIVMVTAKSSVKEFDFISRVFAPRVGINEDPVTGSAHCYLTPYWAKELKKNELTAYQASERGGLLNLEMRSKNVIIKGKAITVFRAELINY